MQRLLKIYIICQECELKRILYKRELIGLYVFQKSPYSMLLFWRYSKICNITQSRIGQFINLTSLFYRQWTKCIVFMLIVQPSVQHYSCYMAWKTKVHTWCRDCHLCINAPMWRGKKMVARNFWPSLIYHVNVRKPQASNSYLITIFFCNFTPCDPHCHDCNFTLYDPISISFFFS